MVVFLSFWRLLVSGFVLGSMACGADAPAVSSGHRTAAPSARPQVTEGFAGRVVDESGRAVQGALIVPRSLGPTGPAIPELAVLSDEAGRFEWPVPAGTYEVLVTADGHRSASREVSVAKGKVTRIEVVLGRER